jgi:hypothetical protein
MKGKAPAAGNETTAAGSSIQAWAVQYYYIELCHMQMRWLMLFLAPFWQMKRKRIASLFLFFPSALAAGSSGAGGGLHVGLLNA